MAIYKKRNWSFVVYPESAPENWVDILQATGLPVAISPLHNKDINATGEAKKPHWHILVCYDGPVSQKNVSRITEQLNSPLPQGLDSVRGMYRYFTHKDNPEKAQYSENDIKTLNGFNIAQYIELSKSEVAEVVRKIHIFINDHDITELCDLADLLLNESMMTEYNVLINHTYFIEKYIASRRHKFYAEKEGR